MEADRGSEVEGGLSGRRLSVFRVIIHTQAARFAGDVAGRGSAERERETVPQLCNSSLTLV